MNDRKHLSENCEEAAFALFMADCMSEDTDGYVQLYQRLKNDPTQEVPEEINQKNLHLIETLCQQSHSKAKHRSLYKIMAIVALIMCCLFLTFITVYTARPAVQKTAANYVQRVTGVSALTEIVEQMKFQ